LRLQKENVYWHRIKKKIDRTYRPGDVVSGSVVVKSKSGLSHNGITMKMSGTVTLQLSAKSVGLFEAFYNSLKPITILDYDAEIQKSGKIKGLMEYPFEFTLNPFEGQTIYETYHGVYVNIQYLLKVDLAGSFFSKSLSKTLEFVVEYEPTENLLVSPENIKINPGSLVVKKGINVPEILVTGRIDSTTCSINHPLTGVIVVEKCEEPIKSIEIQLIRVETCGCSEGFAKEPTEIQNIQIVDGDVPRNWEIPIYMIFPRLFTCPSLGAPTFKVDFEVSIVVIFGDGTNISEKIPIKLLRAK